MAEADRPAGRENSRRTDKGQITILLVDPANQTLDHNAALLQEMGFFNHLQAENGSEALAMVNNFEPEMVVAQQNTPLINGLSLLRLVREQDSPEEETLFVLYGENLTSLQVAQAGRVGANAIILTPCDDESFKGRIQEAIYPPPAPEDEKAEELFDLSVNQIQEGRLDQALETCQSILEIHDNSEVYYNMGYIKSRKGDLEGALACFRRATVINGHHAKAHQQMGLIYQKLGREEEARASLELAAEIHMERNQNSEAEEIFNTVLALKPSTTNVYNSLGIIYRRQGRLEEALKAYGKALKVHKDDEYIYFNIARVHLDMGSSLAAQDYLRQALKINPDFPAAGDLLRATELGLKINI
ncbi:MAG: tetratricopeptide repeat protein [Candidatus Adiutrix sp.]|jgi:tetratricopeptide (TPR) repeat protein|nr:tetratricopeptide repeat protein [Candidatus Adiutrix sp.]